MSNCKKCWCPNELGHNIGCPDRSDALPDAQSEFDKGWQYGFDDNYIPAYRYRFHNKSFIFGYRVGKAEIDALVDEEAQSRCFS